MITEFYITNSKVLLTISCYERKSKSNIIFRISPEFQIYLSASGKNENHSCRTPLRRNLKHPKTPYNYFLSCRSTLWISSELIKSRIWRIYRKGQEHPNLKVEPLTRRMSFRVGLYLIIRNLQKSHPADDSWILISGQFFSPSPKKS